MSPHVPACAGFTSGTRSRRSRTWDHPRSRGVYDRDFKAAGDVLGSSPLARGLRYRQHVPAQGLRIIPARAGFTRGRPTRPSRGRDHPRSRGVYHMRFSFQRVVLGSSPLARGLLGVVPPVRAVGGIIPARAGFTHAAGGRAHPAQDHPRSRGVYTGPSPRPPGTPGSSPLARGLRWYAVVRRGPGGIIPARAGFTMTRLTPDFWTTDHPRSRGVYLRPMSVKVSGSGSSPLARGLLGSGSPPEPLKGIIPARAGFTMTRLTPLSWTPDHPRSRGVYDRRAGRRTAAPGSSPLARGLPREHPHAVHVAGIIPARAGFTRHLLGRQTVQADHPRSRGVYRHCRDNFNSRIGSSPLARGLRGVEAVEEVGVGIIPARAGFTPPGLPRSGQYQDHPRSRGVYRRRAAAGFQCGGSSPLARGLRAPL